MKTIEIKTINEFRLKIKEMMTALEWEVKKNILNSSKIEEETNFYRFHSSLNPWLGQGDDWSHGTIDLQDNFAYRKGVGMGFESLIVDSDEITSKLGFVTKFTSKIGTLIPVGSDGALEQVLSIKKLTKIKSLKEELTKINGIKYESPLSIEFFDIQESYIQKSGINGDLMLAKIPKTQDWIELLEKGKELESQLIRHENNERNDLSNLAKNGLKKDKFIDLLSMTWFFSEKENKELYGNLISQEDKRKAISLTADKIKYRIEQLSSINPESSYLYINDKKELLTYINELPDEYKEIIFNKIDNKTKENMLLVLIEDLDLLKLTKQELNITDYEKTFLPEIAKKVKEKLIDNEIWFMRSDFIAHEKLMELITFEEKIKLYELEKKERKPNLEYYFNPNELIIIEASSAKKVKENMFKLRVNSENKNYLSQIKPN